MLLVVLILPDGKFLIRPGKMNTGHETLGCEQCHRDADGSFRQQMQANIRYWLGQRGQPADVGYRAINNSDCLDCHARKNDRHPVFRFLEPRFKKARQTTHADQCTGCHAEHTGVRVSVALDFCQHCHDELRLKNDPLLVPHSELAMQKKWQSCAGCHDYHGNHIMKTETKLEQMIPAEQIKQYFNGKASPYSEQKKFEARKYRSDQVESSVNLQDPAQTVEVKE